jgi:putative transposase
MRQARWLVSRRNGERKPVFYHVISRVVERRLTFGVREKEKFRTLMRLQEKFTGCRVVSYCLMCNHFHMLLEVPPMPLMPSTSQSGITDDELLKRLSALYNEAFVAGVAAELAAAKAATYVTEHGLEHALAAIHQRFTYRMHDLGEFMKGLLQRFTQWFNSTQSRVGRLWEDRFKSVIVESGSAARTIAAYIDLNPVRAGMVADPADYRWSSYGEAVGGGAKGNGKTARQGLVRAYFADQGVGFEVGKWPEVSRLYRRIMGIALGRKPGRADEAKSGKSTKSSTPRRPITKNSAEILASESGDNETVLPDLKVAKMLHCRVRYFTDGAVIGSRDFVNKTFTAARARFGPKRKDGARKMKGSASAVKGILWSMRDLQKGV